MNLFLNFFSNTCNSLVMENLVKFSDEGFMLVASIARKDRHIIILIKIKGLQQKTKLCDTLLTSVLFSFS